MNKELFDGTSYEFKNPIAEEINKALEEYKNLRVFQVPSPNGKELALKGKIRCKNKGYDVELPIIIQIPTKFPTEAPKITFPNIPGVNYNFSSGVKADGFFDLNKILTWQPFQIALYKFLSILTQFFSKDENYPYLREGTTQLTAEALSSYSSTNERRSSSNTSDDGRFFRQQQQQPDIQQQLQQRPLSAPITQPTIPIMDTTYERPSIAPAMPAIIPNVEALGLDTQQNEQQQDNDDDNQQIELYGLDNHTLRAQINQQLHDETYFPNVALQRHSSTPITQQTTTNRPLMRSLSGPANDEIIPSDIAENILLESSKEIITKCNNDINNYREIKRESELAENMVSILDRYEKDISGEIAAYSTELSPTHVPQTMNYIITDSLQESNDITIAMITRAREEGKITENVAQQLINELFKTPS